jgi:L-iditol 2-dehydrogenase
VDCSGAGPGIADALRAARRGGRLVQIGLAGMDVTVPFDLICFKELTVTAGFASTPASWRRALALLARDAVELPRLVTEVVALRDFRRAFDDSRTGAGVKYVLDPQ